VGAATEAREWTIAQGRGFEPQDLARSGKVAIIGQSTAIQLFGDADPLKQQVRIRNVPFTIIGVLESKGQTMGGSDQDDVIMVPITTAREQALRQSAGTPALRRPDFGQDA